MKKYTVAYRDWCSGEQKEVIVLSSNKADAYDIAAYEVIPQKEGSLPWSAWVESVTYSDGRIHYFNTSEGNAY